MSSTWNKNKAAFQKRFPALASYYEDFLLQDLSCASDCFSFWKFQPTKTADITAAENGLRLHSAYNPVKEAATTVAQPAVAEKGTSIFLGCGLGYHVTEWAKLYPSKKLILIEPDPLHFFAALTIQDWTEVFKIKNLIIALACPTENIMSLLEDSSKINLGKEGVSDSFILNLPAFTSHATDYYNEVLSLINRNKRKNDINAATLKKFGKLWSRNCEKNKPLLKTLSGINQLENAYKDAPFLLVAAGPTLQEILPHMAELKKRTVIICVETALKALLSVNVQPDFIILTDPQYWAYRHIAGLHSPDSILVTEICTYPSVFNFDCKKILLCKSQIPDGQLEEEKANVSFGDLGAGGSVASSAWNLAKYCGTSEIFVCGLDLAFPGKQTHIKGSSAEQTWHTVSNRLASVEKFNTSTLLSANAEIGKDYNGNSVLTDSRMKMFAWWFESRLANCPEIKTYTLSPKGLNIPGIKPCAISEILKKKLTVRGIEQ